MKRRDFLMVTGGVAASLPILGRSATPCPPPSFSTGSQTVNTTCPSSAGVLYSTNFPATENPISEGGIWLGGKTNGNVFKDVRTTPGRAFASGINDNYDDSLAIINQSNIPNNHYVEVVIYLEPGYTAPSSHEIELLLRGNITANSAPLYEILMPFGGTFGQIFIQTGPIGGFQDLNAQGPGYSRLKTGDVVRAQIIGSNITVYVNGNVGMTASDSRLTSGKPGMGFFVRPGGVPQNFCISSWKCGAAS
jgi:hypothetical protein